MIASLNKKDKTILFILLFVAILLIRLDIFSEVIKSAVNLLAPLGIGVGIAFLLNRPMLFFERIFNGRIQQQRPKMIRGASVLLSYIFFILVLMLIVSFVVPQLIGSITQFYNNLDQYTRNFNMFLDQISAFSGIQTIDFDQVTNYLRKLSGDQVSTFLPWLFSWTRNTLSSLFTFLIAMAISVYLLIGKETILGICKQMVAVYTSQSIYRKVSYVYHIVLEIFNKYVVGQLLEACILGVLCYIGMKIFRFDYALLISVMIGITALIPIVGAYIGGGLSVFILVLISPLQALLFLVYLIVLQQLENNLIYPHVVGSSLGLPPILVLLSISIGGGLFGLTGMLLAVPVTAVMFSLIKNDVAQRTESNKT